MHRTLVLAKGGRSVSTRHGMRRILKRIPPVKEYIEKAVETGIYRTSDEMDAAMDALRKGHSGDVTVVEPRVAVNRMRRDHVRGTEVQDYPPEYHILCQHPPIPDPPRTPKKILRRMHHEQKKHPTEKLVQKYLKRQAKTKATTEDYYRKLLGIQPPTENYAMGQKSAALSQAYAYAMKQYQVMRTQDVSEKEALDIVDQLLAEEKKEEGQQSRKITEDLQDLGDKESNIPTAALPSILHDRPRVVEGMMQWSRMLQNSGIPYKDWTVGASTALDHWIARNILDLSEATWDALLEGNDPSLLSRGQDIVAVRETIFPETVLDASGDEPDEDAVEEDDWTPVDEEASAHSGPAYEAATPKTKDKSVEELLASLRLRGDEPEEEKCEPGFAFRGEQAEQPKSKDAIGLLTEELQQWRSQNAKSPYQEWPDHEKERFSAWLEKYVGTLTANTDRSMVDMEQTRISLLSDAPQTEEESSNFWGALQDETKADLFLKNLLQDGPPADLPATGKTFWSLPYDEQVERLVNLGAVRPLFDEYMSDEERLDFFRRYGDYLLDGVEMDYLVPDPDGAITGKDLGMEAIRAWRIQKEDKFKLVKLPYRSGLSDGSDLGEGMSGSDAALERARELYHAWNQHKAGRARYEETLFVRGDLGLTYSSRTPNEIKKEEEEKNWKS